MFRIAPSSFSSSTNPSYRTWMIYSRRPPPILPQQHTVVPMTKTNKHFTTTTTTTTNNGPTRFGHMNRTSSRHTNRMTLRNQRIVHGVPSILIRQPPPHYMIRIYNPNRSLSSSLSSSSSSSLSPHHEINKNGISSSSPLLVGSTVDPTTTTTTTTNTTHNNQENIRRHLRTFSYIVASLGIGFGLGQLYRPKNGYGQPRVLPNDHSDHCNELDDRNQKDNENNDELTDLQKELPNKLCRIVGKENVIMDGTIHNTITLPYLKGARLGLGKSLCIVTPTKLHEVIDVVQAVLDAKCVIIPQGQNTGLTGGSVPRSIHDDEHHPNESHRPVVLLSMKQLNRMFPIDDGNRIVCLAGVGLGSLSNFLEHYFPFRESHSILGSTFLNPTVAAGIAFGSGGTQCRKGPSYTERALYLKITTNKWNEPVIEVINTLGIDGIEESDTLEKRRKGKMDTVAYKVDTWSRWIQQGYVRDMKYSSKTNGNGSKPASDHTYAERLCINKENDTISRYNADIRGPECCRSEGKVIILASVHDTFPAPIDTRTFWIGFDSLETAYEFRRIVCLDNKYDVPISMEYLDRDSFDVIHSSGRLLGNLIKYIGTSSSFIRHFWNLKLYIEALPLDGAETMIDSLLYHTNFLFPSILPSPIMKIGTTYNHNIAITVGRFEDDEYHLENFKNGTTTTTTTRTASISSIDRFMERLKEFETKFGKDRIKIYECQTKLDTNSINAFRFIAASAFRTYCVGEQIQGFSVDYALPMNTNTAPPVIYHQDKKNTIQPIKRMRYSHFACNVVHEDLAYHNDVNIHDAKHQFKDTIEHVCHGKLPAEHGHGTEYMAPLETQQRWKQMDPLNVLNPGIGGLSSNYKYD
jgi:D-lactate dehydrogenase (quinone)